MACCTPACCVTPYSCPCPEPGYLAEPYHLPGYTGHIPTMKARNGGTFGRLAHDVMEDPCVAQAPIPVLSMPCYPCAPSCGGRNSMGCEDLGCCSPSFCPPARLKPPKSVCEPPINPCRPCCDPRAHHLNRSPFACPFRPEPDTNIYRCCESLPASYAGHVPGFTFHSNGRNFGSATWGTKQYMQNCFYYNTFLR